MPRAYAALPFILLVATACAAANSNPEPESRPVRVAGTAKPLTYGDCPAARLAAAEKPDLDVDRIPSPVVMKPPVLQPGQIPAGVITSKGAVIKADVVVDTLGRADMKTFTVVKSTHPWLSAHVKGAIAQWKFSPAELAGCRVARVYHFSATSPAAKSAKSK